MYIIQAETNTGHYGQYTLQITVKFRNTVMYLSCACFSESKAHFDPCRAPNTVGQFPVVSKS